MSERKGTDFRAGFVSNNIACARKTLRLK